MSQNQNDESQKGNSLVPKLPKLPNVEIPKVSVPSVNPQVKQAIDTLLPKLTNEELRYIVQTAANVAQQRLMQRQPTEPVDPVLQEILDDIKLAEIYVTQGYNIEYPPKAVVPLAERDESRDLLDLILERLDPLFKSEKVQNQLARLLGALADKLEGKK